MGRVMAEDVVPMVSSRSVMVSCLTCKSFSQFELIFVHGVRVCSSCIALHAGVQVSQQCLLNGLSFAHFSVGLLAFLLLSCINCLYILEIKSLSIASFETIFSHFVSCLFVFFWVSFAVQKLVRLSGPIGLFLLLFLLFWETDLRKHVYG